MTILKAEERTTKLKSKQLRRKGIVPGVVYGIDSNESLSIQFAQNDVERFLRSNTIGSMVNLEIGDKKQMALLKEISYAPVLNIAEHLTFMPLIAGEAITNVAQIILLNKEKALGNVQQSLFEITYKALPEDLIDRIEIDLDGMEIGGGARASDLEISKNEAIEIITPSDTLVFSIVERKIIVEESEEAEEPTIVEEEVETV